MYFFFDELELFVAGEKFIAKQVDKRKKKKLEKVESKMLGWGRLFKQAPLLVHTVDGET